MPFPLWDDNPTVRPPVCTLAIIAINAAVFLWTLSLSPDAEVWLTYRRGFVPARLTQLRDGQPLPVAIKTLEEQPLGPPAVVRREIVLAADRPQIAVSLLTSMFLHAGWMHLLGNMWFLWIFGNNVEDRLGHAGFGVFYIIGGVLATLCHGLGDLQCVTPMVGASGAVAAVLGAYLVTWPWARVHVLLVLVVFITVIRVPALVMLGLWFGMQLLEATQQTHLGLSGGVAWWAHIGGFAVGAALMPLFRWLVPELSHRNGPGGKPPAAADWYPSPDPSRF